MFNCESFSFSFAPKPSKTPKVPSRPIERPKSPPPNQQGSHDKKRSGNRPRGG